MARPALDFLVTLDDTKHTLGSRKRRCSVALMGSKGNVEQTDPTRGPETAAAPATVSGERPVRPLFRKGREGDGQRVDP
mgnify:CR=1 FL=1